MKSNKKKILVTTTKATAVELAAIGSGILIRAGIMANMPDTATAQFCYTERKGLRKEVHCGKINNRGEVVTEEVAPYKKYKKYGEGVESNFVRRDEYGNVVEKATYQSREQRSAEGARFNITKDAATEKAKLKLGRDITDTKDAANGAFVFCTALGTIGAAGIVLNDSADRIKAWADMDDPEKEKSDKETK